jgi:hypothetical protein
MSRRVTLELPDEVLSRAERLAVLTDRNVAELLVEAVAAALPPLDVVLEESRPVSKLPDDMVLGLAERRLPRGQDRRLSRLLDRQQAGKLTDPERNELLALMQVYEANWLRQSEALAEAVRRGLREPLSSRRAPASHEDRADRGKQRGLRCGPPQPGRRCCMGTGQ